jgi:hypothetical protein
MLLLCLFDLCGRVANCLQPQMSVELGDCGALNRRGGAPEPQSPSILGCSFQKRGHPHCTSPYLCGRHHTVRRRGPESGTYDDPPPPPPSQQVQKSTLLQQKRHASTPGLMPRHPSPFSPVACGHLATKARGRVCELQHALLPATRRPLVPL